MKKKEGEKRAKRHRILRRAALTAGICLLLLPMLAVGAFAAVYGSMDYSADEQLFALAKGSHTTRFYYNTAASVRNCGAQSGENSKKFSDLSFLPNGEMSEKQEKLDGYFAAEMKNGEIHGETDSIWYPLSEISPHLQNAFVAIEDKRYFEHAGVDWARTARAVANYFLGFDGRFGGSTITQQLIKNISSDDELTAARKLREICRAIHLESNHGKEEILELYLNIVPLANGCVGVGAASRLYYGKEPSELGIAEAAAIAAITNSPARYDPLRAQDANRARRDLILSEMLAQGRISQAEYGAALRTDTTPRTLPQARESVYSWYTETVLSDIVRDLTEQKGLSYAAAVKLATQGGLSVYTAMNSEVQQTLEDYFSDLRNLPPACTGGMQMAMTVIDPHTGDLLGVVGAVGEKRGNRLLNYATDTLRAPGSALKPLSVYAPALEEGIITEASVYDDVPLRFLGSGKQMTAWPRNLPAVYSGLTDMRTAVAQSKNTVAVRVFEELGAERSYAYLTRRLGLDSILRGRYADDGRRLTDLAAAPLALGQLTDGVTLRALTAAYGALADGGIYRAPRSYLLVLDGQGNVLLENHGRENRAFSEETAYLMTDLLRGVPAFGTAEKIRLDEHIDLAGKTGTSGDGRDKWFVGYTPYLVAGVWCGYPDGQQSVPTEKKDHLTAFDAVMTALHAPIFSDVHEAADFKRPNGLVEAGYCRDSGDIPCEGCRLDARGERVAVGLFRRGSEPHALCSCPTTMHSVIASWRAMATANMTPSWQTPPPTAPTTARSSTLFWRRPTPR